MVDIVGLHSYLQTACVNFDAQVLGSIGVRDAVVFMMSYRGAGHEFATAGERQRAERSRVHRMASLAASQHLQRIYDDAATPTVTTAQNVAATGKHSWLVLPDSLQLAQPAPGHELMYPGKCAPAQLDTRQGHGSETKQQKGRRAAAFVAWLLATYGTESLNEGTGVLDVAGGKGAISYELQCRHAVRCTLVDPGVRTRLLTPRYAIAHTTAYSMVVAFKFERFGWYTCD